MSARIRLGAVLALLLWLAACATANRPKPEWAGAPDADLPALATFGWTVPEGAGPQSVLDGQVRAALRAELVRKGYVENAGAPDFLVGYDAAPWESTRGESPVSIGIGIGSWGGHVGGSVGASVPVGSIGGDTEGQVRLTIRVLDRARKSELWIGTTTAIDAPAKAAAVERAIAGVMEGFPARRR